MALEEGSGKLERYADLNTRVQRLLSASALEAVNATARRIGQVGLPQLLNMNRLVPPNLDQMTAAIQRLTAQHRAAYGSILESISQTSPLISAAIRMQEMVPRIELYSGAFNDAVRNVTFRIDQAVAGAEAIGRLYAPSAFAMLSALATPLAYQAFVVRQLTHAYHDPENVAERRARILERAGELVDASRAAMQKEVAALSEETPAYTGTLPRVSLFSSLNQSLSFAYVREAEVDVDAAFSAAIPRRIAITGVHIVELVVRVNDCARRKGGPAIFKPTSKGMLSSAMLPAVVADSERVLALVVDHLFFLLYEGSGEAKRLTSLLDQGELAILWSLKHLRLAYRHDVEHGDESDIQAKHEKIGAAVRALIGKPFPVTVSDYKRLQLQLYLELEEMLQRVLSKLARSLEETSGDSGSAG